MPCRALHLRELARNLRAEELSEIERVGAKPRHLLMALYRATAQPLVAIAAGGGVIAAWGDMAPTLADEGLIWGFASPLAEHFPVAFFRETRRWIAETLVSRSSLRSSVGTECARAIRFYAKLGFEIGRPIAGFREMTIYAKEDPR